MTRILSRAGFLALAAALSISAAAKTHSENVTLYHDATLNGTTVPAGDYTVRYDTEGDNAQVKFIKNNKEIASASGHVKTLDKKVNNNQVVMHTDGNARTIREIDFAGKTSAISFEESSANAGK